MTGNFQPIVIIRLTFLIKKKNRSPLSGRHVKSPNEKNPTVEKSSKIGLTVVLAARHRREA